MVIGNSNVIKSRDEGLASTYGVVVRLPFDDFDNTVNLLAIDLALVLAFFVNSLNLWIARAEGVLRDHDLFIGHFNSVNLEEDSQLCLASSGHGGGMPVDHAVIVAVDAVLLVVGIQR